jgi:hypothetical protein
MEIQGIPSNHFKHYDAISEYCFIKIMVILDIRTAEQLQ